MNTPYAYTVIILCGLAIVAGCSSSHESANALPEVNGSSTSAINLVAINSVDDDWAPYVLPNGQSLLFTSNRPSSPSDELLDKNSKYGDAIYKTTGTGPSWSSPEIYSSALDKAFNYSSFALTPGGGRVYFSASYLDPSVGGADIYFVDKTAGQWSSPMSALVLNSKWWDAQPAVSPDGDMIVFSSNRDNTEPTVEVQGYRQPHLWYSEKDEYGNWTAPRQFPAPVNSEYAEITPFLAPDGFLYFATNRYEDHGFDIVRTRRTADGWSEPERLPVPVNSSSDDVCPFVTDGGKAIYFASSRPGGLGGLDLYHADFPVRIRLRGTVTIENIDSTFAPAGQVTVQLINETDNETTTMTTNAEGLFFGTLETDKTYSISTSAADCYNPVPAQSIQTSMPWSFDTSYVRDFTITRIVYPHFKLERYNIPFFVTGYYYPNTNKNLDNLEARISHSELQTYEGGNTPYINRNDEDYRSHANRIEAIFDTIYTSITDRYLSMFNDCATKNERLHIEVRGFVDPRGLMRGIYPDKTVTTKNMVIHSGEEMEGQSGNTKLANLRAYYTLEMIDTELLARSPLYRTLRNQNRIILTAVGVGIDTETGGEKLQDPAKRRIDIELSILPPE